MVKLMSRSLLALVASATLAGTASAAANDLPYGERLTFAAMRNGQEVGRHELSFKREGDRLTVSVAIDLIGRLLGIVVYRYSHRGQEIWQGDRIETLRTTTDANGRKLAVRGRQEAQRFLVERETGSSDQVGQQDQARPGAAVEREAFPSDIFPSSHWNIRQVEAKRLLNTQYGTLSTVRIERKSIERVRTRSGEIEATRYAYTGEVDKEQWFDARGRWVKTRFKASDGSTIEYLLQD